MKNLYSSRYIQVQVHIYIANITSGKTRQKFF